MKRQGAEAKQLKAVKKRFGAENFYYLCKFFFKKNY